MHKRSADEWLFGTLKVLTITVLLIVTVGPIAYMVSLSVRPFSDIVRDPVGSVFDVTGVTPENYVHVLTPVSDGGLGFGEFIGNSAMLSLVTVVGALILSALGAFAAARMRFVGSGTLNLGIILCYLLPPILFSVPMFVLMSTLGLRSTLYSLGIIYLALNLPLAVFLLKNYFMSIPIELDEAARMDGAGRLRQLRSIILPLSTPVVAVVAFHIFLATWDEFLFALLMLVENRSAWTITLAIQNFRLLEGSSEGLLLAACVLACIPVVVFFAVANRYIVEGLTSGGVKE